MAELKEGSKAPAISLKTDSGEAWKLSAQSGSPVVVFFYPKADTPGCTKEACEFRDEAPTTDKLKAIVVGVSPDTEGAQSKFKKKYNIPYALLADIEHQVAEAYGVWVEKSMYGKKYMGIERSTFVIGSDGKIAKIFRKVKPEGHAAEVVAALKSLI
jgi:thioredoxin-dependent peroxiredoxin